MPGEPTPGTPQHDPLPDPALVVLIGASGSGKSTWAMERYRAAEIVSSDALRAAVGSGEHDLDASVDAFSVLEQVVAARLRRGLTTVVDTLGTDATRRAGWLAAARSAGLPALVVVLDTPAAVCRSRNAARERPVPARVLTSQLASVATAREQVGSEGWDLVHAVRPVRSAAEGNTPGNGELPAVVTDRGSQLPGGSPEEGSRDLRGGVVLQVSRFPVGGDLMAWLREVALAAEETGFAGLALMDHLIQIPQVGRAWDPIPEPWVALGALAAVTTSLQLGTLVSPATFRAPGITAKAAATLSALSEGRVFVGLGAGWWEREHAAYGLDFPTAGRRLDALEVGIETMKALWSPGTKPYAGRRVSLPETTLYPRPVRDIPVIVGGGGERTLRIAARLADGCNLPSDATGLAKVQRFLTLAREAGRAPADLHVTVLDLPLVGRDRDDVWARVERHRGRLSAPAYAQRHHAGTAEEHAARIGGLADLGVSTVFVSPVELAGPDDVRALGPVAAALARR